MQTPVLFCGTAALVPLCQPDRCYPFWRTSEYSMAVPARTVGISNPLRILRTLDWHLSLPAELTVFGRAALALGYSQAPDLFNNTQDVDALLPLAWLEASNGHEDFWLAVLSTNAELQPDGLYLAHLFRETDVILQPDWLNRRLMIDVGLQKLTVYRPGTMDNSRTLKERPGGRTPQPGSASCGSRGC